MNIREITKIELEELIDLYGIYLMNMTSRCLRKRCKSCGNDQYPIKFDSMLLALCPIKDHWLLFSTLVVIPNLTRVAVPTALSKVVYTNYRGLWKQWEKY